MFTDNENLKGLIKDKQIRHREWCTVVVSKLLKAANEITKRSMKGPSNYVYGSAELAELYKEENDKLRKEFCETDETNL